MSNLLNIRPLFFYKRLFKLGDYDFITVIDSKKHLKQEQALRCLVNNEIKEIGYGGAAGGAKSWTGCAWLAFMCELYPGTRWFIGREELKRLRESTLISWYKVCKAYDLQKDVDWKYNGQDHYIHFTNGSRIDLLELKELPSDPLFERYGSIEYTGGWIEEAGEVCQMAYDTLKSRCGRQYNDKYDLKPTIYTTFNPKKNFVYNYFYKRDKENKLPKHIVFIKALLYDNPHRESQYEQQLLDLSSVSQKERLLKGNFEYDDDPSALIDYKKIVDIFTNDFETLAGEKYITCDVARLGSDKIVIGLWNGFRVKYWKFEKKRITESYTFIDNLRRKENVPLSNVIADEDGVGGGLVDMLGCQGFVNNSKALNGENYVNLQAQCAYRMAERINKNGIFVEAPEEDKEEIIEELEQLKQKDVDEEGRKAIVGKDVVKSLIGRSPDYRDMLLMREWFEIDGSYMEFG